MPVKFLFLSLMMIVVLAGCGGGGGGGTSVEAGGAQPVAAASTGVADNGTPAAGSPAVAENGTPSAAPEVPPVQNVAKEVGLAWNASLNAEGQPDAAVVGYKIHYGNQPGQYSATVTVDKVTTATVPGLTPGNYYFVLTAFDANGNESGYSQEISAVI
ncbi:fibronectin type III domain-containing protein [Pelotalea chapellei]|uniref:Fibronectin type III domain-containing protein n=1 Tax=Pelotalea chapellei TaxID=44671 RepID=A0ABS5U8A3_9BACT|nr:fibronectin type III domain-containing protein [Pelotalea chapellei]MBT1071869.1 fibronectin type III domain-containing protein [Pelotalea chapellei]